MSWSRRHLLRASGAALLLPLLPVTRSVALGSNPPRRLVVFVVPNGMPDAVWTPQGVGAGWATDGALTALGAARADTAVISGLASLPDAGEFDHGESLADLLRASRGVGATFDQLIADVHRGACPRPSLQVSGERSTPCLAPCLVRQRVSWVASQEAAPRVVSPAALYRAIAPGAAPSSAVLDVATADLARFTARAGSDDRARLDAVADGLASLRARSVFQPAASCIAAGDPPADTGAAYASEDDLHAMLDLITVSLACDVTRVVTFMLGNSASDRPLGFLGMPHGHHGLSHTDDLANHTVFGRWVVGLWASLVERLAATPAETGGRLLDHTDVLFLSDMGDGALHRRERLPVLVAGPIVAGLAGQHVVAAERTPVSNLFTSLLQAHDVDVERFGDGHGPLAELA